MGCGSSIRQVKVMPPLSTKFIIKFRNSTIIISLSPNSYILDSWKIQNKLRIIASKSSVKKLEIKNIPENIQEKLKAYFEEGIINPNESDYFGLMAFGEAYGIPMITEAALDYRYYYMYCHKHNSKFTKTFSDDDNLKDTKFFYYTNMTSTFPTIFPEIITHSALVRTNMEDISARANGCILNHPIDDALVIKCTKCDRLICYNCHLYKTNHFQYMNIKQATTFPPVDVSPATLLEYFVYSQILDDFGEVILRDIISVDRGPGYQLKNIRIELPGHEGQTLLFRSILIQKEGYDLSVIENELLEKVYYMNKLGAMHIQNYRAGKIKLDNCEVLEYLYEDFGTTFRQIITDKRILTEKQIISIYCELMQIVNNMHSGGIFHSKINPSYFVFNETTKQVKLFDFGRGTQYKDLEELKDVKHRLFSCIRDVNHNYAPPEVIQALAIGDVDALIFPGAVDIFAFGMTLYELIVQPPHPEMEKLVEMRSTKNREEYEKFTTYILDNMNKTKIENRLDNSINLVITLIMNTLEFNPEHRMSSYFHCHFSTLIENFTFLKPFHIPANIVKFLQLLKTQKITNSYIENKLKTDQFEALRNLLNTFSEAKDIFCLMTTKLKNEFYTNEEEILQKESKIFEEVLQKAINLYTEETEAVLRIMVKSAEYFTNSDYNRAIDLYDKALNIGNSIYFMAHPQMATLCNNLGYIYRQVDDLEKAEELYTKSLDLKIEINGGRLSPDIATTLNNLSLIKYLKGNKEEAFNLMKNVLVIKALVIYI